MAWIVDDADVARALSHEHAAIGKKCESPGIFELLRYHDHADLLAFGGVEHHRMIRQRAGGEAGGSDRDVELAIPLDFLLGRSELRAGQGDARQGDE